jgi:hypothetical protein
MAKTVKRAKAAKPRKKLAKVAKGKAGGAAVAERLMPGWKAVAPSGPVRSFGAAGADAAAPYKAAVDAVMPSTEELHRKYFGAAGADVAAERSPTKELDDNVSVVEMKSGDLRKAVGVNAKTRKVEWSQG